MFAYRLAAFDEELAVEEGDFLLVLQLDVGDADVVHRTLG